MLYISYRGIFDGNDFQDANTPKQLGKALSARFKCMIDVWRSDGKLYLGNDQPITEEYAVQLLSTMLDTFEKAVDSFCRDDINQDQFDALVSFAYNLGNGSLKSSTLLKKVNANPNDPTIRDEFMKWVNAGGKKLPGLIRRRQAEADLYFGVSK